MYWSCLHTGMIKCYRLSKQGPTVSLEIHTYTSNRCSWFATLSIVYFVVRTMSEVTLTARGSSVRYTWAHRLVWLLNKCCTTQNHERWQRVSSDGQELRSSLCKKRAAGSELAWGSGRLGYRRAMEKDEDYNAEVRV